MLAGVDEAEARGAVDAVAVARNAGGLCFGLVETGIVDHRLSLLEAGCTDVVSAAIDRSISAWMPRSSASSSAITSSWLFFAGSVFGAGFGAAAGAVPPPTP